MIQGDNTMPTIQRLRKRQDIELPFVSLITKIVLEKA